MAKKNLILRYQLVTDFELRRAKDYNLNNGKSQNQLLSYLPEERCYGDSRLSRVQVGTGDMLLARPDSVLSECGPSKRRNL